jgi:hypothetical protein
MRSFIILLIAATHALAVPQLINYQGRLTDIAGTPLDTTVAITFKLYNGSGGGATLLWTEVHPAVAVNNGLFNRTLGATTALTDAVLNNAEVWLGVTVGSNTEMTPREQITSVGYSYRVGTVDGATSGIIYGNLNAGFANSANPDGSATVLGEGNNASGQRSTITGGASNIASGGWSTVGGGQFNYAQGDFSVIAGGGGGDDGFESNTASGQQSTISGGAANVAGGISATNRWRRFL